MHKITVHASIARRTSFTAPSVASLRTGECMLIEPEPDERAPDALIVLIDSITAHTSTMATSSLSSGTMTVLGSVIDGAIGEPPGKIPHFTGEIRRLPEAIATSFFSTVPRREDPVTKEYVQPADLRVGYLLTDDKVPVAFSAAGLDRHSVMLAQSGSGKSYGLGVLLEEIVAKTRLRIVVFDPNDDFTLLAQSLSVVLDESVHAAAPCIVDAVTQDRFLLPTEVPPRHSSLTVVRFEGATNMDMDKAAARLLHQLWSARAARIPTLIVIDEAHNLAPSDDPLKESLSPLTRIAAEGRKFGLWLFLVSQRPQKLNANLISQCDNLILMRLTNGSDLQHVASSFSGVSQSLMSLCTGFDKGEALAAGRLVRTATLFRFRRRLSAEGGSDLSLAWATSS